MSEPSSSRPRPFELDPAAARGAEGWTQRANRRITLEAALEDVRLSLAEGGN